MRVSYEADKYPLQMKVSYEMSEIIMKSIVAPPARPRNTRELREICFGVSAYYHSWPPNRPDILIL
jgi:hypothetical protein